MIGGLDGVGIVLDNQNGVAQIAQRFQNVDEPLRISRVQANRRLIQNIQSAHQVRAQRGGQLNPLRFSARKCGGQAIQRKVVQPDLIQKLQPRTNFLQNLVRYF